MSSRADERIKRSVLFAFVAVSTLQLRMDSEWIADEVEAAMHPGTAHN